jgi:hypothetical protein
MKYFFALFSLAPLHICGSDPISHRSIVLSTRPDVAKLLHFDCLYLQNVLMKEGPQVRGLRRATNDRRSSFLLTACGIRQRSREGTKSAHWIPVR